VTIVPTDRKSDQDPCEAVAQRGPVVEEREIAKILAIVLDQIERIENCQHRRSGTSLSVSSARRDLVQRG
jgi:hypothetical protein